MDPTQLFLFVDVDTQRDLLEPSGALPVPGAEDVAAGARRLVAFAAERSIPIFSSVLVHDPDDKALRDQPPHCLRGTPGAEKIDGTVLPEAIQLTSEAPRPLPAQVIVEHSPGGLMKHPHIMGVIEQLYGRTAVIFGVSLETGVLEAVRGLRCHGLPCRVVRDATATASDEASQRAEREIIETGALCLCAEEILSVVDERLSALGL
jgi:nicotinamidase/pyrazinamidase